MREMYWEVDVVHATEESAYKSVRHNSIWSIIALCTPPRGLRRPPHKTHRTCQLTRRVDAVDDGDVLDSVLWGEGGDNDDNLWS
jgi:hypothetical protein